MITDEPSQWSLKNRAKFKAEMISRLTKFILIIPSNTANERDRKIMSMIRTDMITQEIDQILYHNTSDTRIIQMIGNEL